MAHFRHELVEFEVRNDPDAYRAGGGKAQYRKELPAQSGYDTDGDGVRNPHSASAVRTDQMYIAWFNWIDKDRDGFISDQELQSALAKFGQEFCLRTVHLLMYQFTQSNTKVTKVVGPWEFVPLIREVQKWKATFQKYDRDKNGRLHGRELMEAMKSLGYELSSDVLKLFMSKYDKIGSKSDIPYDYFIECCVVITGLTEKFWEMEDTPNWSNYDKFLLNFLPFIVA